MEGQVRLLTLNRSPVNALNAELCQALDRALGEAMRDEQVRVLILTGAPGIFSADLDVREITRDPLGARQIIESFFALQKSLALSNKPIIAAISGYCPAGGTVLSLLCDQRLMAEGGSHRSQRGADWLVPGADGLVGKVGAVDAVGAVGSVGFEVQLQHQSRSFRAQKIVQSRPS